MEIVVEGKDSVNYIPQSLPGIAIGGTRKKAFFRLRCQKKEWELAGTGREGPQKGGKLDPHLVFL